jgi:hypothetical protein
VGIGFAAEYVKGEVALKEPNKNEAWEWHDLYNLPDPLYWPMAKYIEAYKTGTMLFEI